MAVENINPVFFLSPLIPVIFSFALIFYWKYHRNFRWMILFYALAAYAGAIFIKSVFQFATARPFVDFFGYTSIPTGLYYGLQTSFLEVGLAYVVIRHAIRSRGYDSSYAGGYGISLSFWENGVLLGLYPLLNLALSYAIIATNAGSLGQVISETLRNNQPGLFASTIQALPSIGLSGLERSSSLLAHYSWGVLVFLSVTMNKPSYFLIAFPMGLLDAFVPFVSVFGIYLFELLIFALSVIFLVITIFVQRKGKTQTVTA